MFKRTLKLLFLAVCISLISATIYVYYLSGIVGKRFEGRRWQIPSTLYSDTTFIFPGKKICVGQFIKKLDRLGYEKLSNNDFTPGTYKTDVKKFILFLHDLDLPWNKRAGFKISFEIGTDKAIKNLKNEDTGAQIAIVELGPEKLMQFFGQKREDRTLVSIKNVPENLLNAVIAAEDNRFYHHFGVDPKGILRAFITNLRHGSIRQGGSTLTQQLAKNYFLTHKRTFSRKIKELFLSLAIEIKYSKKEILEIYLNEIYFGQKGSVSVNGAGEAAKFYFGKKINALSLSECAVVAGMIKGPNLYSPYANKKLCQKRRNVILKKMFDKDMISKASYEKALSEDINTSGYHRYSRKAPYFIDYVSKQLRELYPTAVLSSMGYSIYTTIDMDVQLAATNALIKGLKKLENKKKQLRRDVPWKKLQGAILVIQPRTGNILAMVGGRNYEVSQFNRITQAYRQPGSCFKPIVTSTLLDVFKPSELLSNEKISYILDRKMWTPDNYSENEDKKKAVTVREMLANSINRAAVDLVVRGGLKTVAKKVKEFGFTGNMKPLPSIALGAFEVTPLEIARAYCAFAADGAVPYPLSLKDVVDEKGKVLFRKNIDIDQVLTPAKAFLMTSMLESVVKTGTAKSLRNYDIDFEVAAKTGTTNNYRDAWFIGYTPDFLALVWVGFDNGDSVLTTGAGAALPIWADLVNHIPGNITKNKFPVPSGVVKRKICRESSELAVLNKCTDTAEEYFLEENQPELYCHVHQKSGIIHNLMNKIKGFF